VTHSLQNIFVRRLAGLTLRKVDQKYLERFEMWCWIRMEISWVDRVRNEVLHRVKEERNILHTIKRRKANWIYQALELLYKSCYCEMIEGIGRRGRGRKQLLDDLKETRRYWNLKEEAVDRTLWRTRFERGYGPDIKTDYEMIIMTREVCITMQGIHGWKNA
jgi:hypothetical protein